MRQFLLMALLYCNLGGAMGRAAAQTQTRPDVEKDFLLLVVNKEALTAELKTWPTDPVQSKRLMEFRVAIGKVTGDKEIQGDKKTPEGIYFTESIMSGSSLPAKYGPMAIPINFPNPIDSLEHKTGYGIWLHGVEQDGRIDAANVTDGCVAFYNSDIQLLGRWLHPHQAIVMISKDAKAVNKPDQVNEVRSLTEQWYTAWQARDLDKYISFYQDDFHFAGKNRDEYKRYKRRVFNGYRDIALKMSDVRVFVHDKYALAMMNQDFRGDRRFSSLGRKLLYWTKAADNRWGIRHEDFSERRVIPSEISFQEVTELAKSSPSTKSLSEKFN